MGVFKTEKILDGDVSLIPGIAAEIASEFKRDLFEVDVVNLVSGGADISLSKGGLFKAVLGLKSALKITMLPRSDGIAFTAGVGIFGQQAIPSAISLFVTWPVIITQVWGMVQQSKLDDQALAIAERYIDKHRAESDAEMSTAASHGGLAGKFCTNCGAKLYGRAKFCPECGEKL